MAEHAFLKTNRVPQDTKKFGCTAQIKIRETVTLRRSVRIRSYSGPYSVQMQENTDPNNSEYGHFSRIVSFTEYKV